MAPEVAAAYVAIAVTLGIAIVGWSRANKAFGLAERSATAAERSADEARQANDLIKQANDRAARAETRATIRNDVRWESRVDGPNWVITNKGLDDAREVSVILRTGDARDYQRIEVGDIVTLQTAVVIDIAELRREKAEVNKALINSMQSANITYFPSSEIPLHQRILWTDAVGGSHTTDEEEHNIG